MNRTPENNGSAAASKPLVELSADTAIWVCSHTGHEVGEIVVQIKKLGLHKVEILKKIDDLIEKLRTSQPDLVIIDIHREVPSGLELIKDLKTSPDYPNFALLPVVTPALWTPQEQLMGQYGVHTLCPHPTSPKELMGSAVRALAAFKTSPFELLIQQAKLAYRNKDYESSENIFQNVRKARASIRTEIGLAHVSLAQGNTEAAQNYTQNAAQFDPKSFQVMLLKVGDVLKNEEEELFLNLVTALLPSCIPQERLAQLVKIFHHHPAIGSQAFLKNKKAFSPSQRALLEGAKLLFAAESMAESFAIARSLYAAAAITSELLNLLGILSRKKGEFELAAQYYREALRSGAPDYRIFFNLGLCLEEAKRPEEAKEAYEQCLKLAPQFEKAWERLGGLKLHG